MVRGRVCEQHQPMNEYPATDAMTITCNHWLQLPRPMSLV